MLWQKDAHLSSAEGSVWVTLLLLLIKQNLMSHSWHKTIISTKSERLVPVLTQMQTLTAQRISIGKWTGHSLKARHWNEADFRADDSDCVLAFLSFLTQHQNNSNASGRERANKTATMGITYLKKFNSPPPLISSLVSTLEDHFVNSLLLRGETVWSMRQCVVVISTQKFATNN